MNIEYTVGNYAVVDPGATAKVYLVVQLRSILGQREYDVIVESVDYGNAMVVVNCLAAANHRFDYLREFTWHGRI
jgi:hypothetical protein